MYPWKIYIHKIGIGGPPETSKLLHTLSGMVGGVSMPGGFRACGGPKTRKKLC